jgi:hypothetical protein
MRVVEIATPTDLLKRLGDRALWKSTEGFTMAIRNDKGQFVSMKAALIADLQSFIPDWNRWAREAHSKGDYSEAARCLAEVRVCRQKIDALQA